MVTRSELAPSIRVLLSALRWRWASAVVLFVVASAAIAASAIGPMFVGAANESVFVSTFRSAPAGSADLLLVSNGHAAAARRLLAASAAVVRLGHGLLQPPIVTADLGVRFTGAENQFFSADLLYRTDICSHVSIVRGHCPRGRDEIAVSQRSAVVEDVKVGSTVRAGTGGALRVVALYRQPPSTTGAYWLGNNYFSFGSGSGTIIQLDPFLATRQTVLGARSSSSPQLAAAIPWSSRAPSRGAAELDSILRNARTVLARNALQASTELGPIAARAGHVEHLMHEIVLAIELQVVLLSLLILFFLGRAAAAARSAELELARRRGFPRRVVAEFALAEPAAVIVVSLPAGILVAWGSLELLAPELFAHGDSLSIGPEAVGAGILGCIAALLATSAASYEVWRRAPGTRADRRGRWALAAESAAVVLGLGGLLVLATGGAVRGSRTDPLASLAPGLLALGAGVIGLRLALAAIGFVVKRTAESPHVAWFLAVRQIARRPSALRQLLPLTVAAALVLFAVGGYFLASSNRARVAGFRTGAAQVVDVAPAPGVDLVTAVRRADPSGHEAMAAALYESPSSELLAVDASRLSGVALWPPGLSRQSLSTLARKLAPPTPAGVVLRGNRLRLEITVGAVPAIIFSATLFDEVAQTTETVTLRALRPGTHIYSVGLQGACEPSCRLISLSPAWNSATATYSRPVEIVLRSVETETGEGPWRSVAFGAGDPGSWTVTPSSLHVSSGGPAADGVRFEVPGALLPYGGLVLSPVDLPPALPSLMTAQLLSSNPPGPGQTSVTTEGLDGNGLSITPVGVVAALPQVGSDAALVDLTLAERAESGTTVGTTYQVWLSGSASPTIIRRLRRFGVQIGPATHAAAARSLLDHGGLALAYDLALIVSPVAVLLALGTVGFGIVSEGRLRRREMTSLKLSGISTRVARRALLLENGVVLVTVLVVGGLIGFAAAALALPSLPEFADGTGGIPIAGAVPIGPVAAALGAFAVALAATVAVSTALVARPETRASGAVRA